MSSSDFENAFGSNPPPSGGLGPGKTPIDPKKILVWLGISVVGLVVILFFASGQGGLVEVSDSEAAVIVNYLTGSSELVNQPGYKIFLPFVSQAYVFDKRPQEFVMGGDRDIDENHVSKLTVRAIDGSNFWFDDITIQYELKPDKAIHVLSDSGSGDVFKHNWVRSYARSILRDEFGKFSAREVANPTVYTSATNDAEIKLNEVLGKHGIRIIQIITPKPKFDAAYERAIDDRKAADQEVERLKERAIQLEQERERRLAEIDAMKAVEYEGLKGQLEADRIAAERDQVRVEKSADAYSKRIVATGEAEKAHLMGLARGMEEKARKEAEGLAAIVTALEKRGEVLVRERLAQRFAEMRFELVPYTRDPAPTRVELLGGSLPGAGGQP